MPDTGAISNILGLGRANHASLLDMSRRIEEGFSLTVLEHVSSVVAPGERGFVTQIVPLGTLKRRKANHESLSPHESERVKRVVDAFQAAMDVYHDDDLAREFLKRPHPMLDRQPPRDVALKNQAGLDAVMDLLGRGKYGSAA